MTEHVKILLFAQNTTGKNQDTYIKIFDIKYKILDIKKTSGSICLVRHESELSRCEIKMWEKFALSAIL